MGPEQQREFSAASEAITVDGPEGADHDLSSFPFTVRDVLRSRRRAQVLREDTTANAE